MKIKSLIFTGILVVALLCSGGVIQAVDNSALIAQLQAQIASLIVQIQELQKNQMGTGTWCHDFNSDFGIKDGVSTGISVDDASGLENVFTKEGLESPGIVGAFEGDAPKFTANIAEIVAKIQQKYGIRASGWVGPVTRAKLNKLYGCKTACIQMTASAVNPANNQCKVFSTPCDIPTGWNKVDKCNCPQLMPPAPHWCDNGTVVSPAIRADGCYGAPICVQNNCSNLYWLDNTNKTCQAQKQFCGAFMYYGLQTFNTQQDCLNAVGPAFPAGTPMPSTAIIIGNKPSYMSGEIINFSIKATATDGSNATPIGGFNVIYDLRANGEFGNNTDAKYNPSTGNWDISFAAPTDSSKEYSVAVAFYRPSTMSQSSADQINAGFVFTVYSATGSNINVISPNGGEAFSASSPINISWNMNYNTGSNSISVFFIGPESVKKSFSSQLVAGRTGLNQLTIPAYALSAVGHYKIEICDHSTSTTTSQNLNCDFSDNYFTITQ
jgi:hypothetical protein